MQPCKVWIRLQLPDRELRSLRRGFPEVEFFCGEEAGREPRQFDVVLTEEPLPDDLVERMPRLKWLHATRGGVYPYLSPAIKSRPIAVTGSKGIHGAAFSEFALACIFALAKKLPQCWEAQKGRRWEKVDTEEIAGKTLGILGLGTVGSELARKAKALGLKVIATKRNVGARPEYVDEIGPPEFLPRLLSAADFVALCLASVPSTERILGEKELRSMKRSAYLINLTAGKAVEEKLLVLALKEGWIAGAALDAFARQPLSPDSELWGLANVIISPRIGGAAAQRWELLMPIFAENLRRLRSGEKLLNLVDKEWGY
ncbi:MAG: D-2-hydroxyacid dehydrogenase [Deltaproteobacteria bacterium]|nr:D-2-hydroxyacid dehydrogenase [Deltaproteobacteria bacterium]